MEQLYKAEGLATEEDQHRLKHFLYKIEGLEAINLDKETNLLRLEFAEDNLQAETDAIELCQRLGYNLIPVADTEKHEISWRQQKISLLLNLVFLLPLLLLAVLPLFTELLPKLPPLIRVGIQPLFFLPFLITNKDLLMTGWQNLKNRTFSYEAVILTTAAASLLLNLYAFILIAAGFKQDSQLTFLSLSALLLFCYDFGSYIQLDSYNDASRTLALLKTLLPQTATIKDIDGIQTVPVSEVRSGDTIAVKEGESLPVDGVLLNTHAVVDESFIKTLPRPADKRPGDRLIAASRNLEDGFTYQASRNGNDNFLSHLISLLSLPAPKISLQHTDRLPAIFFLTIASAAIITCVYGYFMAVPADKLFAIFLSFIVISCPPILGLIKPILRFLALQYGRQHGLFLKSAQVLELAQQIDTIVFDKTGTLTHGQPVITDIVAEGLTEDSLLTLAATAEKEAKHPLARAIVDTARRRRLRLQNISAANIIPGKGVETLLNGRALRVGQSDWLKEQDVHISASLLTKADQFASKGKTILFVSTGDDCRGIIALRDPIKEEAPAVINRLHELGLEVILLTGDNKLTAKTQAKYLGISQIRADVPPADKAKEVKMLQVHGKMTAVVGSNISDVPALRQADLGIALAASNDNIIRHAHIVLLHSDLKDVSRILSLSHAVSQYSKRNYFLAFGWNILVVPLLYLLSIFSGLFLPIPVLLLAAAGFSIITTAIDLLRFKPSLGAKG